MARYKRYTAKKMCPDDWLFVQDLIYHKACYALPPRRCFARTPQHDVEVRAVQYEAAQHGSVEYSATQYNAMHFGTVKDSTVQCNAVQCCTVMVQSSGRC